MIEKEILMKIDGVSMDSVTTTNTDDTGVSNKSVIFTGVKVNSNVNLKDDESMRGATIS